MLQWTNITKYFLYYYSCAPEVVTVQERNNSQLTTSAHTHTHTFNGPLSGTTQVSRYQKGETNLDFTEARNSEWQWNLLDHMQVCTLLQTDNHASTPPLSLLQAGCPSCRPTNSVKALKAGKLLTITPQGHTSTVNVVIESASTCLEVSSL